MTTLVVQVQGAEPRCFLLEVNARRNGELGEPQTKLFSVWALSVFDALEQGRRGLQCEKTLSEEWRGGHIERVAVCAGGPSPLDSYWCVCDRRGCGASHFRLGVLQ